METFLGGIWISFQEILKEFEIVMNIIFVVYS